MDAFHINRLKLAFVATLSGTVDTQRQLNKAIHGIEYIDITSMKAEQSHPWYLMHRQYFHQKELLHY